MTVRDYPARPSAAAARRGRKIAREAQSIADLLKDWGEATVNRFCYQRADRSSHVLAHTRDLAPGTVEKAKKQLAGRDGRSRRRFMAAKASDDKLQIEILPTWAVDPVTAKNNADLPHDNQATVVDQGIPDDLRWLDVAISKLFRVNMLRALCVRQEYCGQGSQRIKAARVAEQYGGELTLRQYRFELTKARVWLAGYRHIADPSRYSP